MQDANRAQIDEWNERSGRSWVRRQRELDAMLAPFGTAVADRLELTPGLSLLDVGCGAGATTRALAERIAPGEALGVDVSTPLVEHARALAGEVRSPRFEVADAQEHDFGGARFDRVFSRFGVMFFADPIAAFANLLRATRAGGRLGFVCWRAASENPSFTEPLAAVLPLLPEPPAPPQPGAPGPFAFADDAALARLLERAGWREVAIEPFDVEVPYGVGAELANAVDLALDVGPASRAVATLPPEALPRVRTALEAVFAARLTPDGVRFPAATWMVTARRPGD
jgi:SAM-dependent methyltransferase